MAARAAVAVNGTRRRGCNMSSSIVSEIILKPVLKLLLPSGRMNG